MNNRAAIYVTDIGFLYPTLVSASQLYSQAKTAGCDVLIYLINVAEQVREEVENAFPQFQIHSLSDAQFKLPSDVHFKKDHVAVATLGRLVLFEHIPERYDHVVYIDGDTQILGDVSGLLTAEIPMGFISAGRGGLWLSQYENGPGARADRAYIKAIGTTVDEYFNAGVLAFRRQTLASVGPAALTYFFNNSKLCRQHDQSALNAVCRGRVSLFWPGYNYHASYDALRARLRTPPAIVHFTGPLKPWLVKDGPAAKYAAVYDEFDQLHPSAASYRTSMPEDRISMLLKQWRKTTFRAKLFFWRPLVKRYLLQRYERAF